MRFHRISDDVNSIFVKDQLCNSAACNAADRFTAGCAPCANPVVELAVFLHEGIFRMARARHVLVITILANVHILDVVVGDHDANRRTGGQLVFHNAGENKHTVLFQAGGIQLGLTGFPLIQFLLNVLCRNAYARRAAVHNAKKSAVEFLRYIRRFPEATGI